MSKLNQRPRGLLVGMGRTFLGVALVLAGLVAPLLAGEPGSEHRPDLQTLIPTDLRIHLDPSSGQKLLRFSNTVANLGDGPLELVPEHDPASGLTHAYQRFYTHDPGGEFQLIDPAGVLVGSFELHPSHGHWHFGDFAEYQLRDRRGNLVAESRKVSFCLVDVRQVDPGLEHSEPQQYTHCDQDLPQGISVGWGDEYSWTLPDQWVDVTGLPGGIYWLLSIADPENRLFETQDTNNGVALPILLFRNRVFVLRPGD